MFTVLPHCFHVKVDFCVPVLCIKNVISKTPLEFRISYRLGGKSRGIKLRCGSSEAVLSWIDRLQLRNTGRNQPNLVDSEPSVKRVDKVQLTSEARIQSKVIDSEPSLKKVDKFLSLLTGVIEAREREALTRLRAMMERSKVMKVGISLITSNTQLQIQLQQLQTLYILKAHSSYLVQSEALTAAESLAGLNEELLEKIDLVPLRIGLTNLKSVVDKADYKLKLRSLDALRMSSN